VPTVDTGIPPYMPPPSYCLAGHSARGRILDSRLGPSDAPQLPRECPATTYGSADRQSVPATHQNYASVQYTHHACRTHAVTAQRSRDSWCFQKRDCARVPQMPYLHSRTSQLHLGSEMWQCPATPPPPPPTRHSPEKAPFSRKVLPYQADVEKVWISGRGVEDLGSL
jgi:hypothetical protein